MHEAVVLEGHAAEALERLGRTCLAHPGSPEVAQSCHAMFKAGRRPFVVFGGTLAGPAIHPAVGRGEQESLCAMDPERLFPPSDMPPHGWTIMRAADEVDWEMVADSMEPAYRHVGLKRMLKALEG